MKVLISLSVCLLFVFIIFIMINFHEKQFRYRLSEKIQLKGRVKVLTLIKANLNNQSNNMQFSEQTTLEYDTNNHIVYGTIYLMAIRDTLKFYYENDTGRNRIELMKRNVAENTKAKYRRLYQHNGNNIEVDEYYIGTKIISNNSIRNHVDYYCGINPSSIGGKILTQSDNRGNLIEWKNIIHDTEVVGTITGKYDSDGNLIEEEGYMVYDDERHRKLIYKYENKDSAGNWLKRTAFKNGKPFEIVERKIQYY